MQADEFEKKIQDKLKGFELVPATEVWKQVSDRIHKEKKKRRALIYLMLCGFVLLFGTSVLLFTDNKRQIIQAKNSPNNGANYKKKRATKKPIQAFKKVEKNNKADNIIYSKKDIEYFAKAKITGKKTIIDNKEAVVDKSLSEKSEPSEKISQRKNYKDRYLPPHRFYNPFLKSKVTEVAENNAKNTSAGKETHTPGNAKNGINSKNTGDKKWRLGITAAVGISDNLSGFPLLSKSSNALDYVASPVFSPGTGNNAAVSANNFRSDFSYAVGLEVQKLISKKVSVSTGLNYHSYRSRSTVGQGINNRTAFYDASSGSVTLLQNYYSTGSSVTYTNKYQLVQLPVIVEYRLNNNSGRPFKVSAGISPAYLLSSNALYANSSANVYYLDKQKYHRFHFFSHFGFSFALIASHGFLVTAGPDVQFGITNAIKTYDNSNQHLFFTGLKANIIFK